MKSPQKNNKRRIRKRIQVTLREDKWQLIDAKLDLVDRKLNDVVKQFLVAARF